MVLCYVQLFIMVGVGKMIEYLNKLGSIEAVNIRVKILKQHFFVSNIECTIKTFKSAH